MRYPSRRSMPERMVALSLLPPPNALAHPAPFGYGAFVITGGRPGEAQFALFARGFGAGYDRARMRADLGALFHPETMALIYAPPPSNLRVTQLASMSFPNEYLDLVPRSGMRTNILAPAPRHLLANAASLVGLRLADADPSPLGRVAQIGAEAQATWVYWLFKHCAPQLRRNLLASYAAWQQLEHARRSRCRS